MTDSPLTSLATAALDALTTYWPTPDPITQMPVALPARRYVFIGTPASDCEQVVVAVQRTFSTASAPSLERYVPISEGLPYLRTMELLIQILRCVTTIEQNADQPVFPAPDAMTADATAVLFDADTILDCLIAAQSANALAGCGGIAIGNWKSISAVGGLAGGSLLVRLNLF